VTNNTLQIGAIKDLVFDNPGCLLLNPELPIWNSPQR
jgi:hypothetical protein